MDEVVGDVDARQGGVEVGSVAGVALDDLDVVGPRVVAQPAGSADQAAHPVAGREQLGHETAPDVAGGAGDEDTAGAALGSARSPVESAP